MVKGSGQEAGRRCYVAAGQDQAKGDGSKDTATTNGG